MKKRIRLMLPVVLIVALCAVLFAACTPEEEKPTTYTVAYVSGVTEGVTGTAPTEAAHAEGDKFKIKGNTFTLEGKEFTGWKYGDKTYQADEEFTMPAANVTFTAQWKDKGENPPPAATKHSVTFEAGATTGVTGDAASLKKELEKDAKVEMPLNPFTRSGYVFKGWKVKGSTDNKVYAAGDKTYTMGEADVVFEATWAQVFTLTFDRGGAQGGNDIEVKSYEKDAKVTLPALPTGWTNGTKTFDGWTDGTNSYAAGSQFTMPGANTKLTAQWKDVAPAKHNVTFEAGSDDAEGDADDLTLELAKDATVEMPANPFTNNGYVFNGWKVKGSTDNKVYKKGDTTYKMGDADVVFEATWVMITYSVEYTSGVATGVTGTAPVDSFTYTIEDDDLEVKVKANTFTYDKHFFAGWKIDGEEPAVLYDPYEDYVIPECVDAGATVEDGEATAKVTFVAVWAEEIKAGTWKTTPASADDEVKTLVVDIGVESDVLKENRINIDYNSGFETCLAYDINDNVWKTTSGTHVYSLEYKSADAITFTDSYTNKDGAKKDVYEFGNPTVTTPNIDSAVGIWDSGASTKIKLAKDATDNKLTATLITDTTDEPIETPWGKFEQYKPENYICAFKGAHGDRTIVLYFNEGKLNEGKLIVTEYYLYNGYEQHPTTKYTTFFPQDIYDDIPKFEGDWVSEGDDYGKYTLKLTFPNTTMTAEFVTKATGEEDRWFPIGKSNGKWVYVTGKNIKWEDVDSSIEARVIEKEQTEYTFSAENGKVKFEIKVSQYTITYTDAKDKTGTETLKGTPSTQTIMFAKPGSAKVGNSILEGTWTGKNSDGDHTLVITKNGAEDLTVTYTAPATAGSGSSKPGPANTGVRNILDGPISPLPGTSTTTDNSLENQTFTREGETNVWKATVSTVTYTITYKNEKVLFTIGEANPVEMTKKGTFDKTADDFVGTWKAEVKSLMVTTYILEIVKKGDDIEVTYSKTSQLSSGNEAFTKETFTRGEDGFTATVQVNNKDAKYTITMDKDNNVVLSKDDKIVATLSKITMVVAADFVGTWTGTSSTKHYIVEIKLVDSKLMVIGKEGYNPNATELFPETEFTANYDEFKATVGKVTYHLTKTDKGISFKIGDGVAVPLTKDDAAA